MKTDQYVTRMLRLLPVLLALLFFPFTVLAHGGEDHSHDEKKPTPITSPEAGGERWEIRSPEVELLGILKEGKLTVYADRYASNAPILDGTLELESQGKTLTLTAGEDGAFHGAADWLAKPGRHDLIASLQSEHVLDLIVGSVEIGKPSAVTETAHWHFNRWWALVILLPLALMVAWWLRRRRNTLLALPLLLAVLMQYPTPSHAHGGEDHGDGGTKPPPLVAGSAPQRLADGSLYVPKATQRLLQIRTMIGKLQSVPETRELTGHIIADPNHSGRVQASQTGRLAAPAAGFPTLGMKVRKGQVLASIQPVASSIEQGNQQALLAELDSQLLLAEKRAQRLRQLEGSVPQKEIDAAQAEAASLKQRKAAVSASLYQRETLVAPVSGVVSLANVTAGQVVEAREVLFEVVDPARLRVEAIAYDSQLSAVSGATAITADRQTTLNLRYLGQSYQLREQALPLQFEIVPPVPVLSVGQPVQVVVASKKTRDGIQLPRDSVIKDARGDSLVWEHEEAERFLPKKVKVVEWDAQTVMVLDGIYDGARVVTQGAAALSQIR